MRPSENIEKLIKKLRYKTSAETHDRVLDNVLQALDEKQKQKAGVMAPDIWSIIMKTKATKLGVAALIIACIALSIPFMEKTVTPAYSVEQTLRAMQDLRTMYMACKDWNGEQFEMWIELNPDTGIPEYCRAYWPKSKVLNISRPDTSYQFSERANQVQINSGQLYQMNVAPAKVFEQLLLASREDPDSVVIFHEHDGQSNKSLIVVITRQDKQSFKVYIDPETKLPVRVQGLESRLLGSVVRDIDRIEFNVELPEGVFDFEIPEGASIIDHDRNSKLLNDPQYGISTEGMAEQEAAETIATIYWNAIIETDATTVQTVAPLSAKMAGGSLLKELVEVGKLYIQPGCGIGKLIPCRIRYKDGSLKEWKLIIKTRNIDGQPSCVIAGFYASPVEIEQAK
jgi:hypothetical protein